MPGINGLSQWEALAGEQRVVPLAVEGARAELDVIAAMSLTMIS